MAKHKNTLIIDCQVLQTNAWNRGMGKYSLSLIEEMHNQNVLASKTVLLLNANIETDPIMLQILTKACPNATLVYLDLSVPSAHQKSRSIESRNKQVLDQYIDNLEDNNNIEYLILSLFLDQVFIVFPTNVRKLLIFYDLIPFIFEKRYSARINYEDYLIRFRTIFEADLIYTISQTVADDLSVYLGIPRHKLQNINGAPINRNNIDAEKLDFELPQKYILMNSGDELRKNNLNAVKGFAEFNQHHGNEYVLIITSFFGEATTKELQIYSDNLIFSGNVSEAKLKELYDKAEFVFFPSEYEGLGLPILEAVVANKKVACSNIPVFREISNEAFYFFDPYDSMSIANALNKTLQGHDWSIKKSKYTAILNRYTWEQTVKSYSAGHNKTFKTNDIQSRVDTTKAKIAIFAPHPSGYSAIGKVVSESHAVLSERFDIDYYFDYQPSTHNQIRPDYLSHIATCYDASEFNAKQYTKYDAVLYNIGNSDYHLNTIKNALYMPGYVILHDTHLNGAFGELARLGWITNDRLKLEEMLNSDNRADTSSYLSSLVNVQLGAVVHSKYAKKAIESLILNNDIPISIGALPLEAPVINAVNNNESKIEIGLAGILADVKGLPLLEELAGNPDFSSLNFKIFGFSFIKPDTLTRLEKFDNVRIYLDPSDFEFQTYLSKLDILINYRNGYNGETSLTVLEAMRFGVVPIVRKIGWYDELPDQSIVKVNNIEELKEKLLELVNSKTTIIDKASESKDYIVKNHSHLSYAKVINELLKRDIKTNHNLKTAKLLRSGKTPKQLI